MKSVGIKIPLARKNKPFHAGVAITYGTLNDLDSYSKWLHSDEEVVFKNYKYHQRKESYLLGRMAAKRAISVLTGYDEPTAIKINSGVFQFPVVSCPLLENIQVSISHSRHIGFCIAFPEYHPMGVDVETIQEDNCKVIASQLTKDEKEWLKNSKDTVVFTALFSAKEALSKILRTGMMLDFKFLETANLKWERDILKCEFKNFGQYQGFVFFVKNQVFSLVLPKKTHFNTEPLWKMLNENY